MIKYSLILLLIVLFIIGISFLLLSIIDISILTIVIIIFDISIVNYIAGVIATIYYFNHKDDE